MLYDFSKRIIDILFGLTGIILFSPILIAVAIAIKLNSPGPILAETPMRVGRNGKLFRMYKFRSMVNNAYDLLHKDPRYREILKIYKKNSYKLDINVDPRITKVGRFIRKTSIDEFPQFFNIVQGNMSAVGPRAYYPFELEEQQKKFPESKVFVKIILSAKPGLTGLWQVSGRSNINFDRRVELDAQYVQRRSILYDIYLILKTIPAVLFGRGAV